MPIIQVDHLTKEYRLGAMQGLKQSWLKVLARTGLPTRQRQGQWPYTILDQAWCPGDEMQWITINHTTM